MWTYCCQSYPYEDVQISDEFKDLLEKKVLCGHYTDHWVELDSEVRGYRNNHQILRIN